MKRRDPYGRKEHELQLGSPETIQKVRCHYSR